MKYAKSLLTISILSFSLSAMALVTQPPSGPIGPGGEVGGFDGGAVGGNGGGNGGAVGGNGGGQGGTGLQPVGGGVAILNTGAPQFGINDVKPTSAGGCSVTGITSGAWAGSPCEKIYGPTPP